MKTIGCNKELREKIKDLSQPKESVDSTLNRLLDAFEEDLKNSDYNFGKTNINLHETTYNRINNCRAYEKEPLIHIIKRLIKIAELNSVDKPFTLKVNGIEMTFEEFKSDFIDLMNLEFSKDYNYVNLCTSSGIVVDKLLLEFPSNKSIDDFIDFIDNID